MAAEVQALQRVSAVIVTYNSAAVVASCLRSLGGVREVVVVDNNSADSTIETVRAAMPRARIIASADNLGYGTAANIVFQQASGEFALLINPDAALRPQAIERLVAAADRYENAAVLAPVLVDSRTQIQRSHNASLMERDSMARKRSDPVPEGDVSAGFLSGAVLLLRKCALQSAGGFDPAIFLYYEDDDLSLRMRRAGFGLVLVADAVAEHIGGAGNGNEAVALEDSGEPEPARQGGQTAFPMPCRCRRSVAAMPTGLPRLRSVARHVQGTKT